MDRWRIEVLEPEHDPQFTPREDARRAGTTLIVLGLFVAASLAFPRDVVRAPSTLAPARASSSPPWSGFGSVLPSGWQVHLTQGLILAVPREWGEPQVFGPVRGGAGGFVLFTDGASVTQWAESDVRRLVERRFVQGNPQVQSVGVLAYPSRGGIELITDGMTWSGPGGSGTYQARSLFIPLTPDRVVQISVTAPRRPGVHGVVAEDQVRDQALVARFVQALRDSDGIFAHSDVERALAGIRPALTRAPRNAVQDVTRGKEVFYDAGDPTHFVHVATYPDPAARRREDPNHGGPVGSLIEWISPVTYRGVGNVLVIAGGDGDFRYRVVTALDALLP